MVVDRDIRVNDLMLVKARTPITEAHIRNLKRWSVAKVSIETPERPEQFADLAVEGESRKRFSDQVFMREKTRMDKLFQHVERDAQMKMIKQCILNHLEGRYHRAE